MPSMGQRRLRVVFIVLLAAAIAACGAGSPSGVPPVGTGAATQTAPVPSGHAPATIKVEPGQADGPGGSVSEAIANAGIGPQLVNGILLRAVDGTVWLCEVLLISSPPQCAEPRLLVVENRSPEDQTFVNGEGLHEADGVRWVENVQVFGKVSP